LQTGQVSLPTEQSKESQSEKGMVRVADTASLPGVVDLAKGVK
jgi:hypothetical protein